MYKKVIIIVFIVTVSLYSSCSTSVTIREENNFSLDWQFMRVADSITELPDLNHPLWMHVNLPHDYSFEAPFQGKIDDNFSSNLTVGELGLHLGTRSTGYLPGGAAWYKKTFTVPVNQKDKQIYILFDGVMMYADVYINSQHLGHHHYGYTPFNFNITKHLKPGKENTILVRTNNKLESRWYAGSGIYRPVKLIVTNSVHVPIWGAFVTTPKVGDNEAVVNIKTTIVNKYKNSKQVIAQTTIYDENGKQIAMSSAATKEVDGEILLEQKIKVPSPVLWELKRPHLYTAVTRLKVDNDFVDNYTTTFGIRTIRITAEQGLLLNGQPVKLKGVNIHHDNGLLGAESYDWSEERKVLVLKEMGVNAIRFSHNPPSEAILNMCDKHGMLAINEAFDEWKRPKGKGYAPFFDKYWKQDINAMLKRDRNHPSIFAWSIGNEVPEQGTYPDGAETAKMLADYIKTLDTTRFTTHSVQPGFSGWGGKFPHPDFFSAVDICGYNYEHLSRANGGEFEANHKEFGRIMYHGESMNMNLFEEWQNILQKPYVLGDFVWTGIDYLGEVGCGANYENEKTFPFYMAICGDIDICGHTKSRAFYRNIIWNKTPIIHAHVIVADTTQVKSKNRSAMWGQKNGRPSWTWNLEEGHEVDIEVYSGADAIELFVNQQSYGKRKNSEENEYIQSFKVPYIPGELKAVAYDNQGNIVDTFVRYSVFEAKQIKLSVDKKELISNGMDIAYIDIELTDDNGNRTPLSDTELKIDIQGPATIAGLGTASPKAPVSYPFHGNMVATYEGKAQLIIRSETEKGAVRVTITSDKLKSGFASIITE